MKHSFLLLFAIILICIAIAHMPFQILFSVSEGFDNSKSDNPKNYITSGQERLFKKHFAQHDNEPVLVPWRDTYCENKGLIKANAPYLCTVGKDHRFKNCRCLCPDTGLCAECWPEVSVQEVY